MIELHCARVELGMKIVKNTAERLVLAAPLLFRFMEFFDGLFDAFVQISIVSHHKFSLCQYAFLDTIGLPPCLMKR